MRKLVFIISLLILNILYSYSQEQQAILNNALQSYQKELPVLQETIFRKFCKLNKGDNIRKKDMDKYQIIVVPTFKLNENFIQYKEGDMLASYINFKEMWDNYDGYIFKDTSYIGNLFFEKGWSYFDLTINKNLAKQIKDFNPDMVFYPDCALLLCCIKDGELYIAEMRYSSECVFLPEGVFIEKYPSYIVELSKRGFPALKRYKEIK